MERERRGNIYLELAHNKDIWYNSKRRSELVRNRIIRGKGNEMKLSIIIPVYNMAQGNKLQFCLDSLLNIQLKDTYEVIAVDDKSTDDSLEILYQYKKKYPQTLKVIESAKNNRQGAAKNLGLKQAGGEWIGFADSDDWVALDMYQKLLNKAEETGADVIGCDYCLTYQQNYEKGKRIVSNDSGQTGELTEEKYKKLILSPGSMVIKIYKRELFFENNLWFPEGIFYEDNCLAPLLLLYAKRFERVEEALYYYYQHETSTVHHISMDKCEDRLSAMELFWQECQERGFYSRFPEEIDYRFFELYYKNTLFTYMQGVRHCRLSYLKKLKKGLLSRVPDFSYNSYYQERTDAENKKLIALHMKSGLLFLVYYRLLYFYRRLRYGKK